MACDIFKDTHIITHTHHRTLVTSVLSCLLFWWLHSQHQSVSPRHASVNVFWHTHKYCYKCFSQKIWNNFTIGLRKLYFSQSWQLENCSIFWYMIYLNDASLRFYFIFWGDGSTGSLFPLTIHHATVMGSHQLRSLSRLMRHQQARQISFQLDCFSRIWFWSVQDRKPY